VIYGDILPKRNCIDDIFRKITVRTLRVQTWNVDFVEKFTSLVITGFFDFLHRRIF
jgi:hypothetical protein